MVCKTAVVIPYYQEKPGILRGAVESAITQDDISELEIIVVDDGSPAPARDDLKGLNFPAHVTLKLIEQPNRGPGAARNRGLDAISPDTIYVAFLDSDDTWTGQHLSNAHAILEEGYDFYFADAMLRNKHETQLARTVDITQHVCINVNKRFYQFHGNATIDLLSWRIFCHPSTAVYRYYKFPELRFAELSWLGEDWNFWLELIRGSSAIGFSSNVECMRGNGVNIGSSGGWDSPKCIWELYQYMKCRKWLKKTYELDEFECLSNDDQIKQLRVQFATALLHEIRVLRAFTDPYVIPFLSEDPIVLWYISKAILRITAKKLRSIW